MDDPLAVAEIRPTEPTTMPTQALSIFNSPQAFREAAEMAAFLAKSTLVPTDYRGNPSNTMIAIDIANRIGASPLMVMQNLYIVHGKPSWSSSFVISVINACGRFSHLRFEFAGEGDGRRCKAVARTRDGEVLEGPEASIEMAKKEGWYTRNGSKWPTMSELMLRYRAAAFFGRLYCPDILNGMYTADEVSDFAPPEPQAPRIDVPKLAPPPQTLPPRPDREPGDDLSDTTQVSIEAALRILKREWNADTIALASRAVGHLLPDDVTIDGLTQGEGEKIVAALNKAITKRAQQPTKGGTV